MSVVQPKLEFEKRFAALRALLDEPEPSLVVALLLQSLSTIGLEERRSSENKIKRSCFFLLGFNRGLARHRLRQPLPQCRKRCKCRFIAGHRTVYVGVQKPLARQSRRHHRPRSQKPRKREGEKDSAPTEQGYHCKSRHSIHEAPRGYVGTGVFCKQVHVAQGRGASPIFVAELVPIRWPLCM